MSEMLLEAVGRYADAHVDASGIAVTPVQGLSIVRAEMPSELVHALWRPLVCLVLQGCKQVAMGANTFGLSAGESLLITADMPTLSQITQASIRAPYLSVVFELDIAVIAALAAEMAGARTAEDGAVRIARTDCEVADVALRLMRLVERPAALPILGAPLVRELHYWLLEGQHGAAIRDLGWPEGRSQKIARSVAVLRAEFSQPLPVERLAAEAGMSLSSFHQHFRAVTTLSPLQFQKQLRLIDARRLMIAEGLTPGSAAFAVGYESVPQFTREYGRMFGLPPARETEMARRKIRAAP